MKSLVVIALACGLVTSPGEPVPDFTVHEWGTFTTKVDAAGAEIVFDRAPERFELPSFVHRRERKRLKGGIAGTVRMETPVLYVHADAPLTIDVDVRFRDAVLTEWYPAAAATDFGRLAWADLRVEPTSNVILPTTLRGGPYYCARGVDAATLTTTQELGAQSEKFIFYRGVGSFTTPLFVTRDGDRVVVKNRGAQRIDQVFLFESDARGVAYSIRCFLDSEQEHVFDRAQLDFGPDMRLDDLKKILRGQGLREDEAQTMVDTWRDSWFEPGLRVLYTVPREVTDAVLPLTITPTPRDLLRVMIGRTDLPADELPAGSPANVSTRASGSRR